MPMCQPRPELYPYQKTGIEFLQDRERAFLADEPGLGKSRQLWEASVGTTLVVAPAMVLDGGTWYDETHLWPNPQAHAYTAAYSALNARQKTGKTKSSTKPIMALHDDIKAIGRIPTLVLDECHYVKGRHTTWTYAAELLAKQADQVFLATGTPIPNWPHELFMPLRLLFPDEAKPGKRFGSYWRWVDDWFDWGMSPYREFEKVIYGLRRCSPKCGLRPPTDPCDHYHEFVADNLGDRFLQRLRDDVLPDLPPLTQQTIKVEMTANQATAYRQMKKEYLATIDGAEIVAWSAGAKNVMLDRMTTGLGVVDTDSPPTVAESGKFKRLEYDLTARARPTLVVAHYQQSVEAAAEVARSLGAKTGIIHGLVSKATRIERARAFQRGELDVLCGSLETISEGLNLQQRADMVIFLEKSFKPSRNEQALRRIHRLGQVHPVSALDYVSVLPRGGRTVDGAKRDLLATKTDLQMRVLTAAQFASLL